MLPYFIVPHAFKFIMALPSYLLQLKFQNEFFRAAFHYWSVRKNVLFLEILSTISYPKLQLKRGQIKTYAFVPRCVIFFTHSMCEVCRTVIT